MIILRNKQNIYRNTTPMAIVLFYCAVRCSIAAINRNSASILSIHNLRVERDTGSLILEQKNIETG